MKFFLKEFFKKNFLLFSLFFLFIILAIVKEPWHDELFTKYLISHNLKEIIEILKNDNGPPFYYCLSHFLTLPFNHSIFSLRLVSIIFVFLSIIFLNKTLQNLKILNIPKFIFLLFPIPMFFMLEARCYGLVLFLSSLLFFEITKKERIFPLSLYLILLIYTHYFSFTFLTYLFFAIFFKKNFKYLLIILIILIFSFPLYFLMKEQPKESLDWTRIYLKNFSPFYFFSNFSLFYKPLKPNLISIFLALLNILLLFSSFKKRELRFLHISFFLNFIFLFIFSFIIRNYYVPFKTEVFFSIPFFLLIFSALFIEKKYINFLKNLYFLIILISSINTAHLISLPLPTNEKIREILKLPEVWTNVCIVGNWGLVANYYLEKDNLKFPLCIFPPSQKNHLGWYINKPIDPIEVKWLKKEVIFSEKPFLILWHKNDPYSIHIKRYLYMGIMVFNYGEFWFCFLNQPIPPKLLKDS